MSQDEQSSQTTTTPEPSGGQPPDRPAAWWRNPVLMVPACTAVVVALIGVVANLPRTAPTATPTNSAVPSPPASGTAGPSRTPETGSATPAVRRQEAGLTLAEGDGIDLDSTASNWGTTLAVLNNSDVAFYSNIQLGAVLRTVPSAPSKADCDKPGFKPTYLGADDLADGTVLCVKTNDGKVARVTVAHLDRSANSLTIDVLVWN